jgi:hypothetical protein
MEDAIMTRRFFFLHASAVTCVLLSAVAVGQTLPGGGAGRDRAQLMARFERVPEAGLKALYLHCARESSQRLLGFDEAVHCSIAGEVLKANSFGGDFNALLAWWRLHRDDRLDNVSGTDHLPVEIDRQRQ